jgi:hypothetical protein
MPISSCSSRTCGMRIVDRTPNKPAEFYSPSIYMTKNERDPDIPQQLHYPISPRRIKTKLDSIFQQVAVGSSNLIPAYHIQDKTPLLPSIPITLSSNQSTE